MNKAQIGKLLALVACATWVMESQAQDTVDGTVDGPQIVYRNGTDPLIGFYAPANKSLEYGDEIELDGTSRLLSSIKLEYFSSESAGSVIVRVRELKGDPVGAPNTRKPSDILYQSPSISFVNHLNTIYIQDEDIPDGIVLDDKVLVSFQLSGLVADQQVGVLLRNPPTHGQSADDIWLSNGAGDWALSTIPGSSANFAIEVVAVPEPSSFLLAILGGALLFGVRRKRA